MAAGLGMRKTPGGVVWQVFYVGGIGAEAAPCCFQSLSKVKQNGNQIKVRTVWWRMAGPAVREI